MRIVVAHNRYKYIGGEDSVVSSEVAMLRRAGHTVELFEADNRTINSTLTKIAAARSLFHSDTSSRKMAGLLKSFRPDILHIHNWFPLLSPSIISTAYAAGVPVVQTLHNFRMFCANGLLYRDGKVCQDCAGKSLPLGGVVHGCYSNSRIGSALVTAAFSYHRLAHTWDGVSTFITLTEFQRTLLIAGGVDAARTVVKPNFVTDPGKPGDGNGGYALFVGRLTVQKGIHTVLKAWETNKIAIKLKIIGDGPLADFVRTKASLLPQVEYLGQKAPREVFAAMAGARFLVFSSESYESFALTIIEAFSCGTPVLAADNESITDLIKDGQTALRFATGNAYDLAAKATLLLSDTAAYQKMRRRCRRFYEAGYTDIINYKLLMKIYEKVSVPSLMETV